MTGAGERFDVRDAFAEHGGEIRGFVLNSIDDPSAADDCVQEIFVKAWRARDRFDGSRASRRTWLFAIARNAVVDHHRIQARRPTVMSDERVEAATEPALDPTPQVAERLRLTQALALLSEEHRQVVVAIQVDGMDYEQLSRQVGVPVGTLRTRMFYGLRALRTILEEEPHG